MNLPIFSVTQDFNLYATLKHGESKVVAIYKTDDNKYCLPLEGHKSPIYHKSNFHTIFYNFRQ